MKYPLEPYRIKVVERIRTTTRARREDILKEAGYNLFLVKGEDCLIDLLTDSGTSAMSDEQWAGLVRGDEAYASSRSFFRFDRVVKEITGFTHVIPTHQGRAAERILFSIMGGEGKTIPNNTHFDTTRANVEFSGATALDLAIPEARIPAVEHPFKGNIDIAALEHLIEEQGTENIPLVMITITNNTSGGQPVSLENIRAAREVCDRAGLPLFLDACRFAENAWFIKHREPGQHDRSIREIAGEIFSYADGCTMSAKKDGLVNIGGFLGLHDEELATRAKNLLILTEGFTTYGGLAGRDLEAIAQGLEEVLEDDYLTCRINQVRSLGEAITEAGVPIVKPTGGHAIYIDARAMLPHIPPLEYPGQAFVIELFREAGIRAVEIGSVMFAHRNAETGEELPADLDLVRLAIPRRVYTQSHLEYVAEAVCTVFERRDSIKGVKITEQAPMLRHFTARFAPLEDK
ncbi:tryptophanase [Gemmatimonadota bacterium]